MKRFAVAVLTLSLVSCAAPAARTPFLKSVDVVEMTDRMAESFAGDPVIGARNADNEPWVISIDRVANHTNQIVPSREKWLYVTRLRSRLAQSDLSRRRHVYWVVNPERWPLAVDEIDDVSARMPPTHVLAAEFHSLTNTSAAGRSDMYMCSFQLTDVRDGHLVWEDRWEVKRAVSGLTFD